MIEQLLDVPRETLLLLRDYERLVQAEASRQNLVAASTIGDFWRRHIVDALQLVPLAPAAAQSWIDVGSGAGIPGLVVAIVTGFPITLLEPRRKRAAFLENAANSLGLPHVKVVQRKANAWAGQADIVTARAVARLAVLFDETQHLGHAATTWMFPKGRGWREELAEARESWQGAITAVPSITSDEAAIIVAAGLKRVGGR